MSKVIIISNNTSYSFKDELTKLPSDSSDIIAKYGSDSLLNFDKILNKKYYILKKNENSIDYNLLEEKITRKPLLIKVKELSQA